MHLLGQRHKYNLEYKSRQVYHNHLQKLSAHLLYQLLIGLYKGLNFVELQLVIHQFIMRKRESLEDFMPAVFRSEKSVSCMSLYAIARNEIEIGNYFFFY